MSFIPQDLIKQWADLTAQNENYANADPQTKAAAQMEYFANVIAPKVSPADSEKAQLEWAYTVLPDPTAVYQNSSFLAMPEVDRKRVLRGRLTAEGQDVTTAENKGGVIDDVLRSPNAGVLGAVYQMARPTQPVTFDPKVEEQYKQFENDPGVSALRGEARVAEAVKPLNYLKRNVAAFIPGDKAKGMVEDANDYANRTQSLEQAFPETRGIGTASTVAATIPAAVGIEAAAPVAGIGSWVLNSIGQGVAATPMMGQPVNPNSPDIKGAVRSQQVVDAGINTAITGGLSGAASPPVRNAIADTLGVRLPKVLGGQGAKPAAVAGAHLAKDSRTGLGVNDRQILQQLQGEQQNLHLTNKPVMFTGAESGSDALANMQVNVPGQNPNEVNLKQFQRPVNPALEAVDNAAPKNTDFLNRAKEYITTKLMPQTKAEFTTAKKNAVGTLEKEGKDFVNTVYQGARDSGVLAEPLGITQNQLAARASDLLKDPNMQKYGVENLPSVKNLLRLTEGKAPLTVDDAMRLQQGLAKDFKSTNAEGLKPFIDMVANTLDGSQSEGVKQLRGTVAEYQNMLDENITLTKSQFDASAGLEKTLATQPLKKSLLSGKADSVAATFKGKLPTGELESTMADEQMHKALKASISSDIADTLNGSALSGKEKIFDTKAFYKEYGSDEAFGKLKTIFKDDPEYIKQLEQARAAGEASTKFANRKDVAASPSTNKIASQLASGGAGEALGVRTQLTNAAGGLVGNFFNKKSRQFINESVGDKAKAMLIFDKAIKAQKGRIRYKDIYDEVVMPLINQVAPKASMGKDSDVPTEPLKLTIGQKKSK